MAINGWDSKLISKSNASSFTWEIGVWWVLLLLLKLTSDMIMEQSKVPGAEGKAIEISFFFLFLPLPHFIARQPSN